jgi:hypothetical protein
MNVNDPITAMYLESIEHLFKSQVNNQIDYVTNQLID